MCFHGRRNNGLEIAPRIKPRNTLLTNIAV